MKVRGGVLACWALLSMHLFWGSVGHAAVLTPADPLDASITRYNLGVAQVKSGDATGGMAALDSLVGEPVDTDEQRVLRDRTYLALGYAALQAQQPAQARAYLARVPLQAPESNQALLGFGWAALELNAPQSALVPWLTLIKRDPVDSAVLQAKMAVPYAYQQLKAYGKALQYYTEALETFERERISLDEDIEFVRSGRFVDALLNVNQRGAQGPGWRIDEWPDVPHAAHLSGLVAQTAFIEAYKNLRDARRTGDSGETQRTTLQSMAVAELARQKENLSAYTVQARFAVAQLYDRAVSKTKEGTDAPKP